MKLFFKIISKFLLLKQLKESFILLILAAPVDKSCMTSTTTAVYTMHGREVMY